MWKIRARLFMLPLTMNSYGEKIVAIESKVQEELGFGTGIPLAPLGHIWDVILVWRKGNINQNCLCATVLWSTVSGFDLACFNCLFVKRSVSSVFMVLYIYIKNFCLHPFLYYLLVSWAWWDWPLMWLTNHRPSVLWHCWLGHLTHKIVSEMTYYVSSGTLNPTIPVLALGYPATDTGFCCFKLIQQLPDGAIS